MNKKEMTEMMNRRDLTDEEREELMRSMTDQLIREGKIICFYDSKLTRPVPLHLATNRTANYFLKVLPPGGVH